MTKAFSHSGGSVARDRRQGARADVPRAQREAGDASAVGQAPREGDALDAVMRRLSRAAARDAERRPAPREAPLVDVVGIVETATQKAATLVEQRVSASERQTAQALEQVAELIEKNRPDRAALAQALAAMDRRARDSERKTARALSGLVDLIERKPSGVEALAGRLDRIETKLAQRDPAADMRDALRGLDRRIDDIARKLDGAEPMAASRSAMESGLGEAQPRPVANAIAEIARRLEARQARDEGPAPAAVAEPQRLDALQSSIEALAQELAERNAAAAADAEQREATAHQLETLRQELALLAESLRDLAPRAAVGALEDALRDLAERVETQRDRGVDEAALAPVEQLAGELRALLEDMDPTALVHHLRGDVEAVRRRLDQLGASAQGNADGLEELWRQTGEIKELVTTLVARPLPLERLESRLLDLTERVDALSFASSGARDVEAIVKAIRAILASETGHAYRALNQRLEDLSAKVEETLAGVGGARFEQLAERVETMHKALADRIDRVSTRAQGEALEHLVAKLAKKIDASLERAPRGKDVDALNEHLRKLESRLANPGAPEALARIEALLMKSGRCEDVSDLSRRLDAIQRALAARREQGVAEAPRVEELLRRLDGKLDAALAPGAGLRDAESLARQVAQVAKKLDRFIDEAPTRIGEALAHAPQPKGIEALVDRMGGLHAELAQRIEADAATRAEKGQAQLVERLEQLARKIERAPTAGGGASAALEKQLAALLAGIEGVRGASPEAVEASVRRATQEALRAAAGGGLGQEIARDLAELRKTQEERGKLTQQTLVAVHKTLERVVERLAAFEGERSDQRGAQPAPKEFAEPTVASPAPSAASLQSGFIAAARRAAEKAAADAEAAKRAREEKRASAAAPERPAPAPANIASFALQARKRPLLIGLGGLALVAGAYEAARVSIDDPRVQDMAGRLPVTGKQLAAGQDQAPQAVAPESVASAEHAAGQAGKSSLLASAPLTSTFTPPPGGATKPAAAANPGIDQTPVGSIDKIAATQQLAEQGDAAAQFDLGVSYAEGRAVARDFRTAAQWLEKSAAQGMAQAQYRLGALYERGAGVARDYAKARSWYQRAAEAGNVRAMHNLAVLAAEGQDGKPDYTAAAEWFRKAAELGVRDSQFNLAILYTRGLGVQQSLANAYMWFAIAAAQGDEDAAKKRDEVGARLEGKELAAAKAMAEAFRPQTPNPAANEARVGKIGGVEGARPTPAPAPAGKAKVSRL